MATGREIVALALDRTPRVVRARVLAEINSDHVCHMVVVIREQQAPLDVVSIDNYASYALGDDGEMALIASHSVQPFERYARNPPPTLRRQAERACDLHCRALGSRPPGRNAGHAAFSHATLFNALRT